MTTSRNGIVVILATAVTALSGCVTSSPVSGAPAGTASSAEAVSPSESVPVVVVRVIDGDTVDVRPTTQRPSETGRPGRAERVRLLGIDAPESAHDQPAQCGADAATEALREQLPPGPVTLTLDPASSHHDRYGRTLGYLEVDGHDVALTLVQAGLVEAWHPRSAPAPTRHPAYARAQKDAQAAQAGSWATCPILGR